MARCLSRFVQRWGVGVLALLGGPVRGQDVIESERYRIWPPEITLVEQPPPPAKDKQVPPLPPAPAEAKGPVEPPPAAASSAPAPAGELASLAAPNMIGNLLGAGRSVSFFVNRLEGSHFFNAVGSTSLVNPAVADNNSPVPQERVYFRYNHFADALAVTGASSATVPFPASTSGVRTLPTSRQYEDDQYTFGFEKTFFERRASVEFRLPFSTTLAPDLDLSYGQLTSPATTAPRLRTPNAIRPVFKNALDTPQNTLGHEATQLGNLSLIFKWLFLQRNWLYLSSGLAVGVPTGPDTRVRVTDFLGPNDSEADTLRLRDFHIRNQTWSLSPYLAGLVTPTDRFFAQGFVQFDLPLNASDVEFNEVQLQTQNPPGPSGALATFPTVTDFHSRLREQYLLHVDLGLGYWLLRRPEARWLTGFAPALEVHYTSTLNDAYLVGLPGDGSGFKSTTGTVVGAPPPVVGNLRNRVDIVDLTLGTTFELAQRARLATAFSLPLRGADNRTYDWEFHLQLNYYFGASRLRLPPAPNF